MLVNTPPRSWDDVPNGELLHTALAESLDFWWPRIFGYHFLQLGPLSGFFDCQHCPVAHKFTLYPGDGAAVQADYQQLPLQSASIDAAMMHLLLEAEPDPYRILREVDRVLVSGGYLIISGINPFSSAYLGRLLPHCQQQWPWSGRFFMPARVKDWLGVLGYQLVLDERLGYHAFMPQWDYPQLMQHWQRRWLPRTGSLYLLIARKLEAPLTPLMQRQRNRMGAWQPASAGFSGKMKRQP